MKRNHLPLIFGLAGIILWLPINGRAYSQENSPKPVSGNNQATPRISFEKTVHDFGQVSPGEKGNTCQFNFTNTGSALLIIGKIKSTCGCTVPALSKKRYEPGETGTIAVKFSTRNLSGSVTKSIYFNTNEVITRKNRKKHFYCII